MALVSELQIKSQDLSQRSFKLKRQVQHFNSDIAFLIACKIKRLDDLISWFCTCQTSHGIDIEELWKYRLRVWLPRHFNKHPKQNNHKQLYIQCRHNLSKSLWVDRLKYPTGSSLKSNKFIEIMYGRNGKYPILQLINELKLYDIDFVGIRCEIPYPVFVIKNVISAAELQIYSDFSGWKPSMTFPFSNQKSSIKFETRERTLFDFINFNDVDISIFEWLIDNGLNCDAYKSTDKDNPLNFYYTNHDILKILLKCSPPLTKSFVELVAQGCAFIKILDESGHNMTIHNYASSHFKELIDFILNQNFYINGVEVEFVEYMVYYGIPKNIVDFFMERFF